MTTKKQAKDKASAKSAMFILDILPRLKKEDK